VVKLCRSLVSDVVLIDGHMPEMDGLSATSTIKERPEIGVIMVTMHENHAYMHDALQRGAAGYIKNAPQTELIEAARHAARRE
jgi:DNA-binding NarL/FixJ family response regulator